MRRLRGIAAHAGLLVLGLAGGVAALELLFLAAALVVPRPDRAATVEMGHFVDTGSLDFNPNQLLVRKNLRLEAVLGYGGNELFTRGVSLLERNDFPFADLVDPILPLERVDDGFAALTSGYRLDGRDVIKIALRGSAG